MSVVDAALGFLYSYGAPFSLRWFGCPSPGPTAALTAPALTLPSPSFRARAGIFPPAVAVMAEPGVAVRRRSRRGSVRKRSRAPAQPSAVCSLVARKRPSSGGEGTTVGGGRAPRAGPGGGGTAGAWPAPSRGALGLGRALICLGRDVIWLTVTLKKKNKLISNYAGAISICRLSFTKLKYIFL